MADKIEGVPQQPRVQRGGTSPRTERAEAGTTRQSENVARSADDTVKLTDEAQQLQKLERSLATLPAVDEARVAAVKDAISSGEYSVNAERVAERLMQLERDLAKVDPGR